VHDTARYVKPELIGEVSGHDWWHIVRVWRNAQHIANGESVDQVTVELAALLHDTADYTLYGGDEHIGPTTAHTWLQKRGVKEHTITHVCEIIQDLSFNGADTTSPMRTKEGMVAQDADRLVAIGAIGIVRAFAYGGYKNREIYNPEIPPVRHGSFEEHKKNESPTLNHFCEKLLLLEDRMNTLTARQIAQQRHRFMEAYLEDFSREWKGEA
jgi:uncharacterized protein